MKKLYLSIITLVALTLSACGGGNKSGESAQEAAPGENVAETAEAEAPETTAAEGELTFEDFSAQLQEACGLAPIVNDKMTDVRVRKSQENEFMVTSPVADDIDKEAVQREYFNAFAKVAEGNNIYGFHMDGMRGTDAFKDYDQYVKYIKANGDYAKAQYGYDYKGKQVKVYCAVAFGDFGLTVTIE